MISVIVPIYNSEPYIHQCIDSIISQEYRDLEIILIDDGSSDNCGKICDEYAKVDKRIRVFHTENQGLSAARNLGLKEARGEYIGYVDSDDWIEPDMYNILYKAIIEYSADISMCCMMQEYEDKVIRIERNREVFVGTETLEGLLIGTISNVFWNKLFERRVLLGVTCPEGKNYEDLAVMHIILSRSKKAVLLHNIEYHHRVWEGSITQSFSISNMIDCVEAKISRYLYIKNKEFTLFHNCEGKMIQSIAMSYSKIWRCLYDFTKTERQAYQRELVELFKLQHDLFDMIDKRLWPEWLKISLLLSNNNITLFFQNRVYRLYRKIKLKRNKHI